MPLFPSYCPIVQLVRFYSDPRPGRPTIEEMNANCTEGEIASRRIPSERWQRAI